VEDDPAVREVAARALADGGYRVLQTGSGAQALDLLVQGGHRVDLVLSDVVMPGMSGRELATRITELRPGTPVLFMSGYTDGEILRRGLLEPEAVLLPKPFAAAALVAAVRERLNGGPLPGPA